MTEMNEHIFQDILKDNLSNSGSPDSWANLGNLLDDFAHLFRGDLLFHMEKQNEAAEAAIAIIINVILRTQIEKVEYTFSLMIDDYPGKTKGVKIMEWVIDKADIVVPEYLSIEWKKLRTKMGRTIDIMLSELEPAAANGIIASPDHIMERIRQRGGIEKLSMNYLLQKQGKKEALRAKKEIDRVSGATTRRLRAAQAAGYSSVKEHDVYLAEITKEKRRIEANEKMNNLRESFAINGSILKCKCDHPISDGRLLIIRDGKLYLLSDEDEWNLMIYATSIVW
jgi:hypothetical protein